MTACGNGGSVPIVDAIATCTTTASTTAGYHVIAAGYSGDSTYAPLATLLADPVSAPAAPTSGGGGGASGGSGTGGGSGGGGGGGTVLPPVVPPIVITPPAASPTTATQPTPGPSSAKPTTPSTLSKSTTSTKASAAAQLSFVAPPAGRVGQRLTYRVRAHSLVGHVGGWITFTVNGINVPGCTHIALRVTDTAICHLSGYDRPGTYVVSAYYSGSGKYPAKVLTTDEHVVPPWHKVWVLSSTGSVQSRGGSSPTASDQVRRTSAVSPVGVAATPNDAGYWVLEADGTVKMIGNARHEQPHGHKIKGPFVAIASSVDGRGYFLLSRSGAIDSFGDAPVLRVAKLRARAVGFAITPDGRGALVLYRDGAITAIGDAKVVGDPAARHARGPFVGISEDPSGHGYLVLTARGVVLAFGNARHLGNGPTALSPYRAIASTGDGHGYFLLGRGTLLGFGDARSLLGRSGSWRIPGGGVAIAGT